MCCCNDCGYGRVFCSTNFFFLSLCPFQFVYSLGFITCFFNRKMHFLILYAENMDARSRIQHGSSISFVPYQIFSCEPQNDHLHMSVWGVGMCFQLGLCTQKSLQCCQGDQEMAFEAVLFGKQWQAVGALQWQCAGAGSIAPQETVNTECVHCTLAIVQVCMCGCSSLPTT